MVEYASRRSAIGMVLGLVIGTLSGNVMAAEPAQAAEILASAGVQGGVVVHVGCGDGKLTAALRADDSFIVHGLDADAANVDAARKHIQAQGTYGSVSVAQWAGGRLPYIENFANLIVVSGECELSRDELLRVLAPNGVALVGGEKLVKPWPEEIDEWTHYLHGPSNNAVAQDSAIGFLTRMQWIAGPRYSRHHDHMSGASAMVSAGGRVFYIFDESPRASILIPPQWYVYARDAFNGTLLWKKPIQRWHEHMFPLKSGPAILPRRLVAVGDKLYVTLNIDAPLAELDAATGKVLRTYDETAVTEEILFLDGTLYLVTADEQPLRSDPNRVYPDMASIRADATGGLWGEAPRTIMAVDAGSGRTLWKKSTNIMPLTLAVDRKSVYFHDGGNVVCWGRVDGEPAWSAETPNQRTLRSSAAPTLVVYDDVVLFSGYAGASARLKGEFTTMYAVSAKDGKRLWEAEHPPSGHAGSSKDILVLQGIVWCGANAQGSDSGIVTGRDLHTGEVVKEFPPDVQTHWFHQRCYRAKATDKYLLFSRTGIEFVDVAASHWTCHHWVRGACLYGLMPANGLIYNPPHPCACYLDAKLYGFNALATDTPHWQPRRDVPDAERLERGPAYAESPRQQSSDEPGAEDWPTYRGNAARDGRSQTVVAAGDLKRTWRAPLGGRLSPPVVAQGTLYVAAVDQHQVHALDAASGKPRWKFTAGGRVDSPPTVWQGRVLFGSADGQVYCLRASDGALLWRFRAAPEDRRHFAFEQIESVWPVSGSVLVQNDTLYCVAGRTMFLDGGLRLLRLDPKTGKKLSETILDDKDPEAESNLQVHIRGLNMPVALPDILSSDGRYVYMRTLPFDLEGNRTLVGYREVRDQQGDDRHLFSPTGFLDDTLWHRTYWLYGRAFASGAGGYYQAGRLVPSGRILVCDEEHVYGYGRRWQYYRWTTPLEFHLFAAPKNPELVRMGVEPPRVKDKDGKVKANLGGTPVTRFGHIWSGDAALQATAMALADDTLFVAGPPDVIDEEQAVRSLSDPEIREKLAEQEAAFEGKHGALLVAVAALDGRQLASYRLDVAPVFDGLAAAAGRLYLSTLDGQVLCLGADEGESLPSGPEGVVAPRGPDADKPTGDVPPATTSKAKAARKAAKTPDTAVDVTPHPDVPHSQGVSVTSGGLGYQVRTVEDGNGHALRKLDTPVTKQATFKVTILPTTLGKLQTGFLAFGDGPDNNQLVKCGVRIRAKQCCILQGAAKPGDGTAQDFAWEAGRPLEVVVHVDLDAQTVKMTLPGQTIEAKLQRPLKEISHVGYHVMNGVAEFSAVELTQ
ncbi:MAG: methyltransferase domain-containing protein [Planctomycetes bacterium]|nr:methyltransferase domain-containing protein [Planctomycetota bacterium]